MFENEKCWLITGKIFRRFFYGKMLYMSEGYPTQVKFDGDYVLKLEENQGNIIGFYHTHPKMMATPSSTDHETMHSWVSCFGKPLLCLIEGSNGIKTYLYQDDESLPILIKKCVKINNKIYGFKGKKNAKQISS